MVSVPKRFVFLFSDTGAGHRAAAEAVAEAIRRRFPSQVTVDLNDPMGPAEALYSTEVVPATYLAFMIPAPAKGIYALQVVEVLAGENASAPGTVKDVPLTL